ncbi:MAG: hypothetical protein KJO81_02335 [Gammaproteobacteria bacterium]|nr:hypothetical protein [Gammaproteobacteria bacterium]
MKNYLIQTFSPFWGSSKHRGVFLLVALFLASCSIISPFDDFTLNESYIIKRDIAVLYQLLEDVDAEKRQYEFFQRDYAHIVASLNILLDRQKKRKSNEETTKIVQQIRDFVIKYRDSHKQENAYKNVRIKLHRKRLNSLMTALIVAEEAKKR